MARNIRILGLLVLYSVIMLITAAAPRPKEQDVVDVDVFNTIAKCNAYVDGLLQKLRQTEGQNLDPYHMKNVIYSLGVLGDGSVNITNSVMKGLMTIHRRGNCVMFTKREDEILVRVTVEWRVIKFSADVDGHFEDERYKMKLKGSLQNVVGMLKFSASKQSPHPNFQELALQRLNDVDLDREFKDPTLPLIQKTISGVVSFHWKAKVPEIIQGDVQDAIKRVIGN